MACSEVNAGWARYDEKVDIFALGVVVLEMWQIFRTGMERVIALRRLQEGDGPPPDWEAANPQVCCLTLLPS